MRKWVPLLELLETARFEQILLQVYGADLVTTRRAVVVSQWSKFYFMHWWPAVLEPWLVQGLPVTLDLSLTRLTLDRRGLPDAVSSVGRNPVDVSLSALIDLNLRPFIDGLVMYGDVAAGVIWGNAGDYLERAAGAMDPRVAPAALALMSTTRLPDGRRNPLRAPVTYAPDGRRQTRTCCLAHKVDWIGHCAHCPLV